MHASEDTTVLNSEHVPPQEPIIADFALADQAKKDFIELIEKLEAQTHQASSLL